VADDLHSIHDIPPESLNELVSFQNPVKTGTYQYGDVFERDSRPLDIIEKLGNEQMLGRGASDVVHENKDSLGSKISQKRGKRRSADRLFQARFKITRIRM
jgi:hypothetical protein